MCSKQGGRAQDLSSVMSYGWTGALKMMANQKSQQMRIKLKL